MVQYPVRQLAGFSMRFSIRDVLWLTVVVGLAVGWWLDHDFYRRERIWIEGETEARQQYMERLQSLPVKRAETELQVAESELASFVEIRQRNPGAVSDSELRRAELRRDKAMLELQIARAKDAYFRPPPMIWPANGTPAPSR